MKGRQGTGQEYKGKIKIDLAGRIDSVSAAAVEADIFRKVGAQEGKGIVIDAEGLNYISSAGLRVLMKLRKGAEQPIQILNVSRDVYDILEMTGFTSLFDVKKAYRRISVEGLEAIGKGYFGTVYRMDPETIVKVYRGEDSLPMIEHEIKMAKGAFLSGIPTAIAYDIVKVGEDYGSVFEMLDASTYMEWLIRSPEEKEGIVDSYAQLLRKVNATELEGTLPSAKQRFLTYLKTVKGCLPEEPYARLKQLIEAVPENRHAVHGDCHLNNVMRTGDGPMLIDMDTLSVGNAVFELAAVFFDYIPFDEDEPGNTMRVYGIPFDMAEYIWDRTMRVYFQEKDEDALSDLKNRIMLLGWLFFLYRMQTDFRGRPLSDVRTEHACVHIEALLPVVGEFAI